MRRPLRYLGTLMIASGVLTLAWAGLVWQWQDPFTAVYTHVQQNRLESTLDERLQTYRTAGGDEVSLAAARRSVAAEAASYRRSLRSGDPVGRLTVGAIGLRVVIVQGTDHESLKRGPGHYVRSRLPGQGELIYVAGHRTTYGAPFAPIDRLARGDSISIELPYGTFRYVVTRHRIVEADDVEVLRSRGKEELVLQACHPRFFASHRYLVYAKPAAMELPGGGAFALGDRTAATS